MLVAYVRCMSGRAGEKYQTVEKLEGVQGNKNASNRM